MLMDESDLLQGIEIGVRDGSNFEDAVEPIISREVEGRWRDATVLRKGIRSGIYVGGKKK